MLGRAEGDLINASSAVSMKRELMERVRRKKGNNERKMKLRGRTSYGQTNCFPNPDY
jgi:hypothetical protein